MVVLEAASIGGAILGGPYAQGAPALKIIPKRYLGMHQWLSPIATKDLKEQIVSVFFDSIEFIIYWRTLDTYLYQNERSKWLLVDGIMAVYYLWPYFDSPLLRELCITERNTLPAIARWLCGKPDWLAGIWLPHAIVTNVELIRAAMQRLFKIRVTAWTFFDSDRRILGLPMSVTNLWQHTHTLTIKKVLATIDAGI